MQTKYSRLLPKNPRKKIIQIIPNFNREKTRLQHYKLVRSVQGNRMCSFVDSIVIKVKKKKKEIAIRNERIECTALRAARWSCW